MKKRAFLPTLAAATLLACGHTNIPVYAPPARPGAEPARAPSFAEFDLEGSQSPTPTRLVREDVVRVLAWGYPELTHEAVVQPDGKITVPVVGEIQAVGRTIAEVTADVRRALDARVEPDKALRLEVDDTVRLFVWRAPELTHVAVVQPDGKLVLPLVGEIVARGRTLAEVQAEVRQKLAFYLANAAVSLLPERIRKMSLPGVQVSVLPLKLRQRQVMVFGEVVNPGPVPISGDLRVLDALAAARYLNTAALDEVIVIRNPDGKEPQYRRLRLGQAMDGVNPAQNIFLADRDALFVPKTPIAKIGDFIEQFIMRTRPIFDWWYAANAAYYARDLFRSTLQTNELLRQSATPPR
jgi:polysaccharide export outer membrane protein